VSAVGLSEAFGFEEQWLRKLIKVIGDNPDLFRQDNIENSQFLLGGLGNRQVLALKDWARAMGLIRQRTNETGFELSPVGRILSRYDPQLEEDGSLWALHHALCMSANDIWFYASYCNRIPLGQLITRSQIKAALAAERPMAESVIEKKCLFPLLQIMGQTRLGHEFGLLVPAGEDIYERRSPDVSRLHPAVIAYMVCDWASRRNRNTVNIAEMMEVDGVCRYVGLGETLFLELLGAVQERYAKNVLWVSLTAGLNSIVIATQSQPLALLEAFYLERVEDKEPLEALRMAMKMEGNEVSAERP
jgi:hypothetical protein